MISFLGLLIETVNIRTAHITSVTLSPLVLLTIFSIKK